MKSFLPIFFILASFLIFKLLNLDIRFSDSNIYFYTGYQLLQGKILYKDIFFTNFPLLPYASSLYFLLLFGNLKLFFLTPALEASVVGFLISIIVYRQAKDTMLSVLSALLYIFSFIVLSTSDHQSGVFLASLFAVLSYYFFLEKKYSFMGIFLACMLLTKAYFLPVVLSFYTVLLLKRNFKSLFHMTFSSVITACIILLPTLLLAFPDFVKDVFSYSLTRSQGVEKGRLLWFFFTHDFVLATLLFFNFSLLLKKHFFGFLSLFGLLFFVLYQDIYYLYLNFFVPFLCLSFPVFYQWMQKTFSIQRHIIPTILGFFLLYNIFSYVSGYKDLQKIPAEEMTAMINEYKPEVLYGISSLTPALSYLSGIPLLNDVIDTNPNIYRKGYLNAEEMTNRALQKKTLIIAEGADYPLYGVKEDIIGEIFTVDKLKNSCQVIRSFPVQNEGMLNRINFIICR